MISILTKTWFVILTPFTESCCTPAEKPFMLPGMKSIDRKRTGVILAAIALPTDASSLIAEKILGSYLEKRLFDPMAEEMAPVLTRNQCLAGRMTGFPAALLAKGLGLGNGTYTLDAACASSLVAFKLACDALSQHRADAMLVGGVSRPDCLYTQVGFSQLRALSPSGRCAPFDKACGRSGCRGRCRHVCAETAGRCCEDQVTTFWRSSKASDFPTIWEAVSWRP